MQNKMLLPLVAFLLLLAACKKQGVEPEPTDPNTPKELAADASFQWRTTKTITASVAGTAVSVVTSRKFSIQLEDGSMVYEGKHQMNDNFQLILSIPTYANKLIYKYGSIVKEATLNGNTVAMNYLVETENGYIP